MKIYAIFLLVRVNSYPLALLSHSLNLTLVTLYSNHQIHTIHAQMATKLLSCVHVEYLVEKYVPRYMKQTQLGTKER